jgi:hypothetical protein
MALNYADIGMRVLPSYAGDVLADQIRPDRPGAETPGVDAPLPGKGKAGSFTQFATTPFQETEVDLTVDYDVSGDDDGDGPAGTAYPVKGATPFELNITAINTAQVDPAAYSPASASSFKEWLTSKVDERLGTNYTFNPITGGYRPTGPGGAIGLALPGPLGAFAQLGAAASQRSLENIASKAYAGEEGYAVAYVNGRVVGVGPSPFGGYVLSGQLPANLSPQQRQSIVRQLLDIPSESAAGAYRPEGMTAAESIAGAGKPSDDDTTPLPAGTSSADSGYTTYEPSNDASYFAEIGGSSGGSSGNQYSISDPVDTAPAQDYSYTSYEPSGGGGSSSPSGGGSFSDTGGFGPGGFRAKGGRIDMADGGSADPVQGNGFVEGSPDNYSDSQTVADDEFRRVRPGSFVMNAPMTEKLQEAGLLPKGVDNSAKKSTIKANEGGMIDVALSKGEYVFEPEEAEEIGYDVLNKLNDQGKAEVDRRQAAADGGFINGYQEGGKTLPTVLPQPSPVRQAYVGEDIDRPEIPLTDNMIAQFEVYNNSKKQRKDVENLINALDDRENLALVALAETTAETDDIEAMMGVQTTVINRVKSKAVKPEKYPLVRRDFKNVTDVKSALKQRTPGRGSGSFMFQYDGFEPKYLSPKIDSVLKGQVPAFAITKIMASSANVLDPEAQFGEGLFPDTVTFYTREDAPLAKDMELNPQMRYVTTLGGHDFYSYEAAPESPDEEKIYKEYLAEKRKKKKN